MPRYLTRQTPGIIIINESDHTEALYHHHDKGCYGGPEWKLDIGAECNRLLDLADAIEPYKQIASLGINEHDAATLRSIVARVATFEELEEAP